MMMESDVSELYPVRYKISDKKVTNNKGEEAEILSNGMLKRILLGVT
ncbi:MAG: hypothetical protein ACE5PM_05125 [Candidatus Hydrothermarchaeales archaeon]